MKICAVILTLLSFNIFAKCTLTDKEYTLGYEIKNDIYDITAKLNFRCNDVRFDIVRDKSKRIDWISCDIIQKKYNMNDFTKSEDWKKDKAFNDTDKRDYILKKEWNSAIEFQSGVSQGKYFIIPLKEKNHEIYCVNQFNDKTLAEYRPFKLEPTKIYFN